MVGGSDPSLVGGPMSSQQAPPTSSVFGAGVIGSDPTLGDASMQMPWLSGGLRGATDDNGLQSGVSQVCYLLSETGCGRKPCVKPSAHML